MGGNAGSTRCHQAHCPCEQTGLTPLRTLRASEGTGVSTHQLPICPEALPKAFTLQDCPAPEAKSPQAQSQVLVEVCHRAQGKHQECPFKFLSPATEPGSLITSVLEETEAQPLPTTLFLRESTSSHPHLVQVCSEVTFSERPSTLCPSLTRPVPCQLFIFFQLRFARPVANLCQSVPHISRQSITR